MGQAQVIQRTRSHTHKEPVRYECRISRELAPDQEDLMRALGLLAIYTDNYVNYDLNNPGMTIIMLGPILRLVATKNRRGAVARNEVQRFETGCREAMQHARFADYTVKLDPVQQMALYGTHDSRLGLQLNQRDYRPIGDRAMVHAFLCDTYSKPNGDPVSQRFIDKNTRRLQPHVTIGEVRYENMNAEQEEAFRDNPANFLVQAAYARMDADGRQFGSSCESRLIIIPDEISFDELSVVCQQRQ